MLTALLFRTFEPARNFLCLSLTYWLSLIEGRSLQAYLCLVMNVGFIGVMW